VSDREPNIFGTHIRARKLLITYFSLLTGSPSHVIPAIFFLKTRGLFTNFHRFLSSVEKNALEQVWPALNIDDLLPGKFKLSVICYVIVR
jgi:hypothetical protein